METKHMVWRNGWFIITFKYDDDLTWIFETRSLHEALEIIYGEV